MTNKMKITVLSLSCCNPAFAPMDEQYVSKINEVLSKTKAEAKVEIVAATEALFGLKMGFVRKLMPLFNQYGTAVTPALFINGELVLYGGVPSMEKLTEVIQKADPSQKPEKQSLI